MNEVLPGLEGKYQILEKLREGGMGAIYKVRHRLLDEIRVIKVMRPQLESDQYFVERFQREARAASRLRHSNIAQIYDFSIGQDGTAYIVMEFIDGIDLGELLRRDHLPAVGLVLDISIQALTALSFLHQKQFVHRDISPDNLMITAGPEGELLVKLIDLGIAKSLDSNQAVTLKGEFLGKFRYASPEHFGGQTGEETVEPRSDIYSFGIVLYQLFTGKVPFLGKDFSSLTASHLHRPPLEFEKTDPELRVSPKLREIVLKALAKQPSERFKNAETMRQALLDLRRVSSFEAGADQLEETLLMAGHAKGRETIAPGSTQERLNREFPDQTTGGPSQATQPPHEPATLPIEDLPKRPPPPLDGATTLTRVSEKPSGLNPLVKASGIGILLIFTLWIGWRLGNPQPAKPDLGSSPLEAAALPTTEPETKEITEAASELGLAENVVSPEEILAEMRSTRDQVLTLETQPGPASEKAEAWRRYLEAYPDDLTDTEEDNRIRDLARQRQGYWQGRSEVTTVTSQPRPTNAPAPIPPSEGEDTVQEEIISDPTPSTSNQPKRPIDKRPARTAAEARIQLKARGIRPSSEALQRAVNQNDAELARLLILARPDLLPSGRPGRRLLHRSLDEHRLDIAKTLLDRGVQPSDDFIVDAAKEGDVAVVSLLAERRMGDLEDALEEALDAYQWKTARILSQNGQSLTQFMGETQSLLLESAESGDVEAVQWLIRDDPGLPQKVWTKAHAKALEGGHRDLATTIRNSKL